MSTKPKRDLKEETIEILKKAGFDYSDECNIYPKSFDYAAKSKEVRLLLKTLVDINNLSPKIAARLIELSNLLFATPFLIGKKNHGKDMEPNVIYERYGIKSMNPMTLRDLLINEVPPLVYAAPGGKFVNLNSDRLREERLKKRMSRGELASKVGVARSTIRKYEEGKDVSIDVAMNLEEILDAALFESIDLSSKRIKDDPREREIKDPVLSLLSSLGFNVLPTHRAPFRALSESDRDTFLTGVENYNKRLKKKASLLSSVSGVIDYKSFVVIREEEESRRSKIENTPLLTEEEVCESDSLEELLNLIKERA